MAIEIKDDLFEERAVGEQNCIISLAEELPIIADLFFENATVSPVWHNGQKDLFAGWDEEYKKNIHCGGGAYVFRTRDSYYFIDQIWREHCRYVLEYFHLLISQVYNRVSIFPEFSLNTLCLIAAIRAWQDNRLDRPYSPKEIRDLFHKVPTNADFRSLYYDHLSRDSSTQHLCNITLYPLFKWLIENK